MDIGSKSLPCWADTPSHIDFWLAYWWWLGREALISHSADRLTGVVKANQVLIHHLETSGGVKSEGHQESEIQQHH